MSLLRLLISEITSRSEKVGFAHHEQTFPLMLGWSKFRNRNKSAYRPFGNPQYEVAALFCSASQRSLGLQLATLSDSSA